MLQDVVTGVTQAPARMWVWCYAVGAPLVVALVFVAPNVGATGIHWVGIHNTLGTHKGCPYGAYSVNQGHLFRVGALPEKSLIVDISVLKMATKRTEAPHSKPVF